MVLFNCPHGCVQSTFTASTLMQKEDSFPTCTHLAVLPYTVACHIPQLQIVKEAIHLMEVHKQGF